MTMISVIRQARNETGKSWAEIARTLGNTTDTLWRWRNGHTKVPEHRWRALARAIGIEPDSFSRSSYLKEYAQKSRERDTSPTKPIKPPTPPKEQDSHVSAAGGVEAPRNKPVGIFRGWFEDEE